MTNNQYQTPTEMQRASILYNMQRAVETRLDGETLLAVTRGDKSSLSRLHKSLNRFGQMGFKVDDYRDIYNELKTGSTTIYQPGRDESI